MLKKLGISLFFALNIERNIEELINKYLIQLSNANLLNIKGIPEISNLVYSSELFLNIDILLIDKLKKKIPNNFNTIYQSEFENNIKNILAKKLKNLENSKKVDIYYVDLFVAPSNIIEINGPKHFFNDRKTGKSLIKERNLIKRGFNFIDVNYFDWNLAKKNNRIDEFIEEILNRINI